MFTNTNDLNMPVSIMQSDVVIFIDSNTLFLIWNTSKGELSLTILRPSRNKSLTYNPSIMFEEFAILLYSIKFFELVATPVTLFYTNIFKSNIVSII